MPRCPSCSGEISEGWRFCAECGTAADVPSSAPTRTSVGEGTTPGPVSISGGGTGASAGGRFIPGAVLGNRYRIIGLLGRGGMGEVYRADDLKLGIPVALKFLPEAVERDAGRLDRFLNEVRTALRVTHPNVCRVHDVGEIGGQHYLSMEYVDGENLASLLRRIGHLPRDKAIQIARQLCAGLAAAHDEGILHRDLKPANVMIDGRGRAKITDFGLAGLAEGIEASDLRSGTPGYMAPEQLSGREVSAKSDLYALGLVLYELFTGKKAWEAKTAAELRRLQTESTPTNPSDLVDGFDPAVERAILRCLERDPRERPSNAIAVSAALPGGDPLAAALAAGETPSPEMVADAGRAGALRPAVAFALLGFILIGSVVTGLLRVGSTLPHRVPMPKPTDALVDDAREIVSELGYTELPEDTAHGYRADPNGYLDHVEKTDSSPDRWDDLGVGQPPVLFLWYRQSPRPLAPESQSGRIDWTEPPFSLAGMINVLVDTEGRLAEFWAFPPQVEETAPTPVDPDWRVLFRQAGLDVDRFEPATSRWNPPVFADARAAWTGAYPDNPNVEIRVEAAAYRGRPVYFEIVSPWTRPWRQEREDRTAGDRLADAVIVAFFFTLLIGSALMARRNLRSGRGDRQGATKIAFVALVVTFAGLAISADHVSQPGSELAMFFRLVGLSLFVAAWVWLIYVAAEPFVRRRWPVTLISWTRLLAGRFRDPRVGQDILAGGVFAVLVVAIGLGSHRVAVWLGVPPPAPPTLDTDILLGGRHLAGSMLDTSMNVLFMPVIFLFFFLLLRVALRWQPLAIAVFVVFFPTIATLQSDEPWWVTLSAGVVVFSLVLVMLLRFGLLALGIGAILEVFFDPLVYDVSAWYAGNAILPNLAALAIVLYGFYVSLAGQPLLRGSLLPEE